VRKKRAPKRQVPADPQYQDVLVARFVNSILRRGKKHLARRIFYDSLKLAEERTQQSGLDVFRKAMRNVQPILEVRARRVGGATYQVPTEVRQDRGTALAIRWLLNAARERKDKSMSLKLAAELVAAAGNEGNAVKKKEDTHKMAEANKAFAHFRW
jgi:small subunit ribosomal protein S7